MFNTLNVLYSKVIHPFVLAHYLLIVNRPCSVTHTKRKRITTLELTNMSSKVGLPNQVFCMASSNTCGPRARSHLCSAGPRPFHASFAAFSFYMHQCGHSSSLGTNVTILDQLSHWFPMAESFHSGAGWKTTQRRRCGRDGARPNTYVI